MGDVLILRIGAPWVALCASRMVGFVNLRQRASWVTS